MFSVFVPPRSPSYHHTPLLSLASTADTLPVTNNKHKQTKNVCV